MRGERFAHVQIRDLSDCLLELRDPVSMTMAMEQLYRRVRILYDVFQFEVALGVFAKAFGVQRVYLQKACTSSLALLVKPANTYYLPKELVHS